MVSTLAYVRGGLMGAVDDRSREADRLERAHPRTERTHVFIFARVDPFSVVVQQPDVPFGLFVPSVASVQELKKFMVHGGGLHDANTIGQVDQHDCIGMHDRGRVVYPSGIGCSQRDHGRNL
ncbi:MAG: hypothetical protein WD576_01045 [Nitriliruptoraceae bacterium]